MGKEYKRNVDVRSMSAGNFPVLLQDNLDPPLKWALTGTGSDYSIYPSISKVFSGSRSIFLQTKTTTPAINDVAAIYRYFPVSAIKKVRLFFVFYPFDEVLTAYSPKVSLELRSHNKIYYTGFAINRDSNAIYYVSDSNTWTDTTDTITNPPIAQHAGYFLDIDLLNEKYISLNINGYNYDMSSFAITTAALSGDFTLGYIQIGIETLHATQLSAYLDSVLIYELE